ncbi:MAG TPA: TMEM175 family protein [Candidatus Paceibacterota bacterium]|nr:TMEM175 family protein [Candidatus Paceibacterota bacterium]
MQPISKARLEQFSDGVFAIAITLLALEIKVPQLENTSLRNSVNELLPLIPNIATFILSFLGIAIFWVNHHQLTRNITTVSRRVVWGNMLFLLFVTLIPFATSAMAENYGNILAVMTYSLILLGSSSSFSILRYFVEKHEGNTKVKMLRSLVGPMVYSLAFVSAFFSLGTTYALLIIPPLFYFLPRK